ncbi:hypothetical protein BH23ACT10_BH23ACT10_25450 [soil metagenome]
MMVFGWLWPLMVVLVVVVIVFTVRGRDGDGDDSRAAAQALARRYAEGEIDDEEYRQRSATLTASRPPRPWQSSWWPLAIAVGAIALLVAGLLWGGMGSGWMWDTAGRHMGWTSSTQTSGNAAQPYADATVVDVTAGDLWFDPTEIALDADEPTNIRLTNDGQMFHDLTVPDLDLMLDAEPGDTVTAGLEIDEPGTYEFLCTVPGHADAGMRGTLDVS